jgi:hypothetical protein
MDCSEQTISVYLFGGLGNQLFQIALGYTLHKRFGFKLQFNLSKFVCGQGFHPDKYKSSLYKNIEPFFSESKDEHPTFSEKAFSYNNFNAELLTALNTSDHFALNGYWQSESYFSNQKNDLKRLLCLSHTPLLIDKSVFMANPMLRELSESSCLICVRRGDYLGNPTLHNPCGMTYYKDAMRYFPKTTRFFVMSDDQTWCRANFTGDSFVFLDIKDDLDTFYVGTLFNNYIISNSSFYWWISYFSIHTNPKIVAPDKWINMPNYASIYRSEMIILERPVETL